MSDPASITLANGALAAWAADYAAHCRRRYEHCDRECMNEAAHQWRKDAEHFEAVAALASQAAAPPLAEVVAQQRAAQDAMDEALASGKLAVMPGVRQMAGSPVAAPAVPSDARLRELALLARRVADKAATRAELTAPTVRAAHLQIEWAINAVIAARALFNKPRKAQFAVSLDDLRAILSPGNEGGGDAG